MKIEDKSDHSNNFDNSAKKQGNPSGRGACASFNIVSS